MRVLGLLFIGSLAASGQTVLEGDVVNAISGAPIGGVHVYVETRIAPRPTTVTTGSGHFRLMLPPQSNVLRVGNPGYLRIDKQLSGIGNECIRNLRIELCPGAAIAGRIDDEDGFPLEKTLVHVLGYRTSAGERKLVSVKYTQTDDLGQFRFANLRPGRYWLAFLSSEFWDSRYVMEYFPGVYRVEDAAPIDLKPGEEFAADLHLKKQEGVTISGRFEPSDVALQLVAEGPQLYSIYQLVVNHPDGTFVTQHVVPGKYVLSALRLDYSRPPHPLLARLPLTVGREDVNGIVLHARQVQTMNLPYQIIGIDRRQEFLELTLRPAMDSGIPLQFGGESDGSLVVGGLVPGHYDIDVHQRFLGHGPGSGGVRHAVSAQLRGKEVLQTGFDFDETPTGPLVVTLGSQSIEIHGKLLDAAERPVAGELLALISPQGVPESAATTGADGSFRMTVWRAGDYRWVSITDEEEWNDPDYLLAHAAEFPPLRVAEGEGADVKLRLKK